MIQSTELPITITAWAICVLVIAIVIFIVYGLIHSVRETRRKERRAQHVQEIFHKVKGER